MKREFDRDLFLSALTVVALVVFCVVDCHRERDSAKPIRVEIVNQKPVPVTVDVKCIDLPKEKK